jgi:hypothetical protein
MFKQTYGFDVDLLKHGTPVYITDNEPKEKPMGKVISWSKDDLNYSYENKTGVYLIRNSSPTMLTLTAVNGVAVILPIKHFIGDNPRMKIEVYSR